MCDQMADRGPDGAGAWKSEDRRVTLGHRRLSIIDLNERANQPMVSADGRYVITFNGEIYNYRSLRDQLAGRGWRFRTTSDTEVILALYQEKGRESVNELRGMFAFAIWDNVQGSLTLARDPYGIKPLYWTRHEGSFVFASQVRAIIAAGVPFEADPAAVTGFYLFGNVPEPFTIMKSVSPVAPGSTLTLLPDGEIAEERFASIAGIFEQAECSDPAADRDLQEQVREALLDSVRSHLVADVPVGLFLSAGVDSGALLGLVREVSGGTVQTVTLGFEEFSGTRDDETIIAAQVARHYDAAHVERVVSREEFSNDLPRVLAAMDQPTIDGINSFFVSKATRECGLKVALSGTGGDELFGGYSNFTTVPRDVRMLSLLGRPGLAERRDAQELVSGWRTGKLVDAKVAELFRLGGDYPGAYLIRRCLFTPSELPAVLGADFALAGLERLDPAGLIEAQMPGKGSSAFARVGSLESGIYLRNQLLRDTDWASMAHSLEVRLPLVDAALLRKIAPALCRRAVTDKMPLALSPSKPLPQAVTARRKTGFSTPVGRWLSEDERLAQWRSVPALAYPRCKWAKRWAHVVAQEFASR